MIKTKILITTLVFFFGVFGLAKSSLASCTGSSPNWNSTPDQSSVALCVNSASPGDTINVSAGSGSAIWSNSVEITKALSIIGPGASNLTLTSNAEIANGYFYIHAITDSTNLMRISGFTFDGSHFSIVGKSSINVDNRTTLSKLRIDHNLFSLVDRAISLGGSKVNGVVDHNTMTDCNICVEFYAKANTDTQCDGDTIWNSFPFSAGSSNAIFVEDNNFITTNSERGANERVSAASGGYIVIRHNTFDSTGLSSSKTATPIMFHGNALGYYGPYCRRSPALMEIYNNTFTGPRIDVAIRFRGGSSLVHDNTISSAYTFGGVVSYDEEECWSTSIFSPSRTQWPAQDQVFNSFVWNNTLNDNSSDTPFLHFCATPDCGGNGRALDYCKGPGNPAVCCTGAGTGTCVDTFIHKDREYFTHAPQSTGGSESFSGRAGGSTTYPTTGDTGIMTFDASGANAYFPYTPYTYPHPLTLINSDTTAPAVPSGLKIN